jgi:hypothetical protein
VKLKIMHIYLPIIFRRWSKKKCIYNNIMWNRFFRIVKYKLRIIYIFLIIKVKKYISLRNK